MSQGEPTPSSFSTTSATTAGAAATSQQHHQLQQSEQNKMQQQHAIERQSTPHPQPQNNNGRNINNISTSSGSSPAAAVCCVDDGSPPTQSSITTTKRKLSSTADGNYYNESDPLHHFTRRLDAMDASFKQMANMQQVLLRAVESIATPSAANSGQSSVAPPPPALPAVAVSSNANSHHSTTSSGYKIPSVLVNDEQESEQQPLTTKGGTGGSGAAMERAAKKANDHYQQQQQRLQPVPSPTHPQQHHYNNNQTATPTSDPNTPFDMPFVRSLSGDATASNDMSGVKHLPQQGVQLLNQQQATGDDDGLAVVTQTTTTSETDGSICLDTPLDTPSGGFDRGELRNPFSMSSMDFKRARQQTAEVQQPPGQSGGGHLSTHSSGATLRQDAPQHRPVAASGASSARPLPTWVSVPHQTTSNNNEQQPSPIRGGGGSGVNSPWMRHHHQAVEPLPEVYRRMSRLSCIVDGDPAFGGSFDSRGPSPQLPVAVRRWAFPTDLLSLVASSGEGSGSLAATSQNDGGSGGPLDGLKSHSPTDAAQPLRTPNSATITARPPHPGWIPTTTWNANLVKTPGEIAPPRGAYTRGSDASALHAHHHHYEQYRPPHLQRVFSGFSNPLVAPSNQRWVNRSNGSPIPAAPHILQQQEELLRAESQHRRMQRSPNTTPNTGENPTPVGGESDSFSPPKGGETAAGGGSAFSPYTFRRFLSATSFVPGASGMVAADEETSTMVRRPSDSSTVGSKSLAHAVHTSLGEASEHQQISGGLPEFFTTGPQQAAGVNSTTNANKKNTSVRVFDSIRSDSEVRSNPVEATPTANTPTNDAVINNNEQQQPQQLFSSQHSISTIKIGGSGGKSLMDWLVQATNTNWLRQSLCTDTRFVSVVDVLYLVLSTAIIFLSVAAVAFYESDPFPKDTLTIELVVSCLTILFMIVKSRTRTKTSNWIVEDDLTVLRRQYLTSRWFLVDVVTVVPLELIFYDFSGSTIASALLFSVFLLRHLFRIPRMVTLHRSAHPLVKSRQWFGVVAICAVAVMCCEAFAVAFSRLEGANSSPSAAAADQAAMSHLDAIYWTVTTLTSVGYGDMVPTTVGTKHLTIYLQIIGVLIIAAVTSLGTKFLTTSDPIEQDLEWRKQQLYSMLRHYNVPWQVQKEVMAVYPGVLMESNEKQFQQIIGALPVSVRCKLDVFQREGIVKRVPLFAEVASRAVHLELAGALTQRVYNPGEYVFRCGDEGHDMYFIASGHVEIVQQSHDGRFEHVLAVLGAGQWFGETALLDPTIRSVDVQAVELSEILSLSRYQFLEVAMKHPALHEVLESEVRSLAKAYEQQRQLMQQEQQEEQEKQKEMLATQNGNQKPAHQPQQSSGGPEAPINRAVMAAAESGNMLAAQLSVCSYQRPATTTASTGCGSLRASTPQQAPPPPPQHPSHTDTRTGCGGGGGGGGGGGTATVAGPHINTNGGDSNQSSLLVFQEPHS